jgi:hypothetical protein
MERRVQLVLPLQARDKLEVIIVGANMFVRRPLEVKRKGIGKKECVVNKKAYTGHPINIISHFLYFVARSLTSIAGNVFGSHSVRLRFPSTCDLVT